MTAPRVSITVGNAPFAAASARCWVEGSNAMASLWSADSKLVPPGRSHASSLTSPYRLSHVRSWFHEVKRRQAPPRGRRSVLVVKAAHGLGKVLAHRSQRVEQGVVLRIGERDELAFSSRFLRLDDQCLSVRCPRLINPLHDTSVARGQGALYSGGTRPLTRFAYHTLKRASSARRSPTAATMSFPIRSSLRIAMRTFVVGTRVGPLMSSGIGHEDLGTYWSQARPSQSPSDAIPSDPSPSLERFQDHMRCSPDFMGSEDNTSGVYKVARDTRAHLYNVRVVLVQAVPHVAMLWRCPGRFVVSGRRS